MKLYVSNEWLRKKIEEDPDIDIDIGPPPFAAPLYQSDTRSGCVCPPGANKDCENPFCPRKAPAGYTVT